MTSLCIEISKRDLDSMVYFTYPAVFVMRQFRFVPTPTQMV